MSDRNCDHLVVLDKYLSREQLDRLFVYDVTAVRISNKYYYRRGYHHVDPDDRGKFGMRQNAERGGSER